MVSWKKDGLDKTKSETHHGIAAVEEHDDGDNYEEELEEGEEEAATHHLLATATRGGGAATTGNSLLQTLKIGFYFALWYALNIVYNSK